MSTTSVSVRKLGMSMWTGSNHENTPAESSKGTPASRDLCFQLCTQRNAEGMGLPQGLHCAVCRCWGLEGCTEGITTENMHRQRVGGQLLSGEGSLPPSVTRVWYLTHLLTCMSTHKCTHTHSSIHTIKHLKSYSSKYRTRRYTTIHSHLKW